jgi:hypothetical protein
MLYVLETNTCISIFRMFCSVGRPFPAFLFFLSFSLMWMIRAKLSDSRAHKILAAGKGHTTLTSDDEMTAHSDEQRASNHH